MTLRRVAHVVGLLALVVVVAPFVVYAAPGVIGADASYVVLSGSMEPTISAGDVVIVGDVAPEAVAPGDVITFRREGESVPTTHRVVSVTSTTEGLSFTTKGDANEEADPEPVTPDRLVGRVTLVVPVIGYVVQFVDTPLGFGLLVALPFGLLVVTELYSLGRDIRDDGGGGDDGGGAGGEKPGDDDDGDRPPGGGDGDPPPGGATVNGRGEGVATAATGGATTDATETESDGESPPSVVVTRADLRTTGAATAAFGVYAIWVVTQVGVTAWAVGAAVAGVLATLFVGWVYAVVGDAPASEPSESGGESTGATGPNDDPAATGPNDDPAAAGPNDDPAATGPNGDPAAAVRSTDLSTVTPWIEQTTRVETPSALASVAADNDCPVLTDLVTDRLAVVVDDTMYLYDAPAVETDAHAGTDEGRDGDTASRDADGPPETTDERPSNAADGPSDATGDDSRPDATGDDSRPDATASDGGAPGEPDESVVVDLGPPERGDDDGGPDADGGAPDADGDDGGAPDATDESGDDVSDGGDEFDTGELGATDGFEFDTGDADDGEGFEFGEPDGDGGRR